MNNATHAELVSGIARRRRFTTEQKLAVIAETMQPGFSVSYVARRNGLCSSLIYRWRRLLIEARHEAVRRVPDSGVRPLDERIRSLKRLVVCKMLELEILRQTLALARAKQATSCQAGS